MLPLAHHELVRVADGLDKPMKRPSLDDGMVGSRSQRRGPTSPIAEGRGSGHDFIALSRQRETPCLRPHVIMGHQRSGLMWSIGSRDNFRKDWEDL